MTETIASLRARSRELASSHGVSPRDVDVLLADVTGRSPAWLFAHGDEVIDPAAFNALFERRLRREPLQYIRGKTEFYGRDLYVDERVLIPRPDTEILVEAAIARAPGGGRVLDACTGSGAVAISLERERPDLEVFATDISFAALVVASRNASRHRSLVRFAACDALDAIRGEFDLIVSNPPYIPAAEVESLDAEVRNHEPRVALTGGPIGTEIIKRILDARRAPLVMFEIGFGQLGDLRHAARGYDIIDITKDLAGIDRVITLRRRA
jgi:release factor glutamine methyltransferase